MNAPLARASDEELIRAMASGQTQALDEFIGRYQARLTGFAQRYLNDWAAAEDLAQETLLRVWQAAPRFEPRAKVSTWVFGVAYRLALNEFRRRGRLARLQGRLAELLAGQRDESPLERLQAGQRLERLNAELARLPQRQRAALLLRVDQGLSYAQIAQVMELTTAAVESLIHRARQRLRRRLGREQA